MALDIHGCIRTHGPHFPAAAARSVERVAGEVGGDASAAYRFGHACVRNGHDVAAQLVVEYRQGAVFGPFEALSGFVEFNGSAHVAAVGSDDIQVDVFVDWHGFEARLVQRYIQDTRLLPGRKAPGQVGAELGLEQGNALGAAALVADGVFAHDFVERAAVVELDAERVGDRALVRVVVVGGEGGVFDADDLVAQHI